MTAPYLTAPSKPPTEGAKSVSSQRDRRFTDTFFDIHKSARFPRGRPWTGEREYAATPEMGHQPGFLSSVLQCGEYVTNDQGVCDRAATLASAWTAPWLPQAKYFKFNYPRKIISFDYVRGENDERSSLDRYYEAAAKLAGANGWGEISYGKVPNYQITALIGQPTVFLPIFRAARAGDPWLLGYIDEPNVELAKILGLHILFSGHGAERGGMAMMAAPMEVPKPQGVVTPEQVLATPTDELMRMVADIAAKAAAAAVEASFAARDKANKDKMAKARAARKPKSEAA